MIYEGSPAPDPGEVTIFGDPWHGLWTQSTGQIHPPTGPAVPTPGVAPNAGPMQLESRIGDSFAVQVPGIAEVSRPPAEAAADAAAGRSWLNYGIIAGGRRRLYGKNLHISQVAALRTWIYIDDDGGRWLITIGASGGSVLTASRFGVLPKSAGEPTVAQSIDLELDLPFAPGSQDLYAIDDINLRGSVVILSLGTFSNYRENRVERIILRIWKIELSGTPPSLNATPTLIYFMPPTEGGNHLVTTNSVSTVPLRRVRFAINDDGDPETDRYLVYDANHQPTYEQVAIDAGVDVASVTHHKYFLAGQIGTSLMEATHVWGAVLEGDTPLLVRTFMRLESTYSGTIDDAALTAGSDAPPASYVVERSLWCKLRIGDTGPEVTSVGAFSSTEIGNVRPEDLVPVMIWWPDGYSYSDTASIDGVNIPDAMDFTIYSGADLSGFTYIANRLSNRVWSLLAYNDRAEDGTAPSNAVVGHRHIGVVGVSASVAINRTLSIGATNLHGFASAHPMDGTIDWDASDPRCWV